MGVAEKEEVDFDFSEKLHALNEELERQINSLLFERLALSKDREKVLEFYNYVLKCFVLIDLKVGKLTHQDIGQMDFYVRYFEKEEKVEGDNPSIGLILCSDKKETLEIINPLGDEENSFWVWKIRTYKNKGRSFDFQSDVFELKIQCNFR